MVRKKPPAAHPVEAQVARSAEALDLRGKRLLLAVSGGADSVAMLLIFHALAPRLSLELSVATVDHGLRPGSARDCTFVARLAARLGLPCEIARVSVGKEGGVEAAARLARYRALEEIARVRGCDAIATGHTLEDQVETVILRLGRGTGTRGLRGIHRRRGRVVRPLLDISRMALAGYLRGKRFVPREDPTNASQAFDRNRVRAEVLPALERALGPSALRAFARAADLAAEDERLLEAIARRKARSLLRTRPGAIVADAQAVRSLVPAVRRRLLRRAAQALDLPLDAGHVARMERALERPGPSHVELPRGLEFEVAYGELRLGPPREEEAKPFECRIDGPGGYSAGGWTLEVAEKRVRGGAREAAAALLLDPRQVVLPLWLRSRRPGDRFRPRGGHEKKLKVHLIDRKIPRARRDALALLCDGSGQVLWILGGPCSEVLGRGVQAGAKIWQLRAKACDSRPQTLDTPPGGLPEAKAGGSGSFPRLGGPAREGRAKAKIS